MNIICVMAIHRREKITKCTINRLKKQTKQFSKIIVIGDSEIEKKIAEETGVFYIQCNNRPLGGKWQKGIDYCKSLDNLDGIMICGSDGWITSNWCEETCGFLKNFDLVGKQEYYVSKIIKNKKPIIIKRRYIKSKKSPIGNGRLISNRILKKINYELFPINKNKDLDSLSTEKIVKNGGNIKIIDNDNIKNIEIKSNWEVIHTFKLNVKKVKNIEVIENSMEWLEKNFSGSIKDLEFVIGNIKW